MQKHLKLKIFGRVQGIGFRWCAYEKFTELGLTGKAENSRDGTVEIDAQGEDFALDKFVEWARVGPTGARVSNIEILDVPSMPEEPKQAE